MSYPSYTKCCNLEYYGDNHNPVWDRVCHNCNAFYDADDKLIEETKSPFVKGKKLSEYTEEERKQIVAQSKHKFGRKPGFFDRMHISYAQNKIDQGWLDFHGQEDQYNYPLPTCSICNEDLGVGDYRDGHHPYHQEYNACKEHKDDYSNSINNNTDS